METIYLTEKVKLQDSHNQTAIKIRELTNDLKEFKTLNGDTIYKRRDKVFQIIREINKVLSSTNTGEYMYVSSDPLVGLFSLIFYLIRVIIVRSETKAELKQAKKALDALKSANVSKKNKPKIDEKIKTLEELIEKAEQDKKHGVDIDPRNKGSMENRDKTYDKIIKDKEIRDNKIKKNKKKMKGYFLK